MDGMAASDVAQSSPVGLKDPPSDLNHTKSGSAVNADAVASGFVDAVVSGSTASSVSIAASTSACMTGRDGPPEMRENARNNSDKRKRNDSEENDDDAASVLVAHVVDNMARRRTRSAFSKVKVKVENPVDGRVLCPHPDCVKNQYGCFVNDLGCNILTCTNHTPNYHHFCMYCKTECPGGEHSACNCPKNKRKATRSLVLQRTNADNERNPILLDTDGAEEDGLLSPSTIGKGANAPNLQLNANEEGTIRDAPPQEQATGSNGENIQEQANGNDDANIQEQKAAADSGPKKMTIISEDDEPDERAAEILTLQDELERINRELIEERAKSGRGVVEVTRLAEEARLAIVARLAEVARLDEVTRLAEEARVERDQEQTEVVRDRKLLEFFDLFHKQPVDAIVYAKRFVTKLKDVAYPFMDVTGSLTFTTFQLKKAVEFLSRSYEASKRTAILVEGIDIVAFEESYHPYPDRTVIFQSGADDTDSDGSSWEPSESDESVGSESDESVGSVLSEEPCCNKCGGPVGDADDIDDMVLCGGISPHEYHLACTDCQPECDYCHERFSHEETVSTSSECEEKHTSGDHINYGLNDRMEISFPMKDLSQSVDAPVLALAEVKEVWEEHRYLGSVAHKDSLFAFIYHIVNAHVAAVVEFK